MRLPDNLPALATARLPGSYEAAKAALATCEAVDECKSWGDKAAALASYARQIHDEELLDTARRIQARALRRAGELLSQIDARGDHMKKDGAVLSRTEAAEEAGISERQRKTAMKLAAIPEEEFEELIESYRPPTITELVEGGKGFNHQSLNTGDTEWHTPPEYLGAARTVLGGFDLDPASNPIAQETVQVGRFFTKEQDGLAQPWFGRVWLNPPYAQPAITNFVSKLISEFKQGHVTAAILLTHGFTDTKWFHAAFGECQAICFTRGRINFIHATRGLVSGGSTVGQTFFYFGPNIDTFTMAFEPIGIVIPFRDRLPVAVLHERARAIFAELLPYILQITPEGERAALERRAALLKNTATPSL